MIAPPHLPLPRKAITPVQHKHRQAFHGMMFWRRESATHLCVAFADVPRRMITKVLLELEIPDSSAPPTAKAAQPHQRDSLYACAGSLCASRNDYQTRPFTAQLYCGHFERGGKPITGHFHGKHTACAAFQKFDISAKRFKTAEYLVFGSPEAQYAAHVISANRILTTLYGLVCPLSAKNFGQMPQQFSILPAPTPPCKPGKTSCEYAHRQARNNAG